MSVRSRENDLYKAKQKMYEDYGGGAHNDEEDHDDLDDGTHVLRQKFN